MHQRPAQSNNLLTVIRIHYTLTSYHEQYRTQSWNVTVSEVIAIQKGGKNEISMRLELNEIDKSYNSIKN